MPQAFSAGDISFHLACNDTLGHIWIVIKIATAVWCGNRKLTDLSRGLTSTPPSTFVTNQTTNCEPGLYPPLMLLWLNGCISLPQIFWKACNQESEGSSRWRHPGFSGTVSCCLEHLLMFCCLSWWACRDDDITVDSWFSSLIPLINLNH